MPSRRQLIAHIPTQTLALVEDGEVAAHYPISTSKCPPSCVVDSYGTPDGLHMIAEKIGAEAPSGMVFKGRQPIGHCYQTLEASANAENLITSRILRLAGLDSGKNAGDGVDSFDRYIYIHGTNHEERIGEPFSRGCIEMKNDAVIELFDRVDEGDLVWIAL